MTLSEAFHSYAQDVIAFRNQSRKTEENHFVTMKALLGFFGDVAVEKITFAMVRDWKASLDRDRSPETVRNYIIKLRVVLAYLEQQGAPTLSPRMVPVPKRTDKVPSFLSKEQVAQCIEATDRIKNKAIISLLYSSGIRISELCSLDRGQFNEGRFTVIGKGGRARLCFVDKRTEKLIKKYYESRTDNNPAIFLSDQGKRITPGCIQETFKTVRKRTGLEVHPHTLRHSFATNLMEGGMHIYSVSRILGHKSIATTAMYLHITDNNLQREYHTAHSI